MSSPQPLIFGSLQGDSKAKLEQELQRNPDSDKNEDQGKDIDPKTGRLKLPEVLHRTFLKMELDMVHGTNESEKEHLQKLTKLVLPEGHVHEAEMVELAPFIKKYCPHLEELTVYGCVDFSMLAPLLDSTSTIKVLELRATQFDCRHMAAFGAILINNTSLRELIVKYDSRSQPSIECYVQHYGPLVDALARNTTFFNMPGLCLRLQDETKSTYRTHFRDDFLGRLVSYAECDQNVLSVKSALERNRKMQELADLRNDIRALFLDAPLKNKKSDPKLAAEEFDIKTYKTIRDSIKLAEHMTGTTPPEHQELLDELTIAHCSWNNELAQDDRIKKLTDIVERKSVPAYLKQKALAYLAQVYLNKGIISASLGKTMEADNDYMLAFTYALHGEDNHMRKETITQTVSYLFKHINPKEDLRALLEDLAQVDPVKYEAFEWIYKTECTRFKLTPFDFNDLRKTVKTASSSSETDKASRGDSKQVAEAAGQMQSKDSAVAVGKDSAASATSTSSLSLDEDDTASVDEETLREDTELQRAIAASLYKR